MDEIRAMAADLSASGPRTLKQQFRRSPVDNREASLLLCSYMNADG